MLLTVLFETALLCTVIHSIHGEKQCTKLSDIKWIQTDGRVTARYAFHYTLEKDKVLKELIRQAAQVFEEQTCVKWIETKVTDECHKIVIREHHSCSASLNHFDQKGTLLFLHPDCYKLEIILHEMMHALGIRHTHQRKDRDKFVRIWMGNVILEHRENFEIHTISDTYNVPYDYQSIMHYGRFDYSQNNLYTMTPTESLALLSMGTRQTRLRWSDAAMVNHHLDCVAPWIKKCGHRTVGPCRNKGYLLPNCKCSCPENFSGQYCGYRRQQKLYDIKVTCGRPIQNDVVIETEGLPFNRAPNSPCVFPIVADKCYEAHIEFVRVEMPGTTCSENVLAIEGPGWMRTYCRKGDVPINRRIVLRHRKSAIHYYVGVDVPKREAGFQAAVTFHKNTTWPRGTEISESIGNCYLATSGYHYEFRTPYFPSTVSCFAKCSEHFNHDFNGNTDGFMKLELLEQLKSSDKLKIKDRNFVWTFQASLNKSLTMMVQMPVSVTFEGGDDPGNGFAIKMSQGYVSNCDGQVMHVNYIAYKIFNPILNNNNVTNCYLHFKASTENGLYISLKDLEGDTLSIGIKYGDNLKKYLFTEYKKSSHVHVKKESAIVYYEPKKERKNWYVLVSMYPIYHKTHEPDL